MPSWQDASESRRTTCCCLPLLETLLGRFGARLLLLEDTGCPLDPVHLERLRRWQQSGACQSITLDGWDVERVRSALRRGLEGMHTSDTPEAAGAQRGARDPVDVLEQRAGTLECFAQVALAFPAARFVAISALAAAAGPAIAGQNEFAFDALRRTDRHVHALELGRGGTDRDAVDGLLGALRLGGHVAQRRRRRNDG